MASKKPYEDDEFEDLQEEVEDLRHELEVFQQEKEKVRAIVGQAGGVPQFRMKLFNAIFIIVLAVSVVLSFVLEEKWQLLMIELATVTLSIKIIYLIHCQVKVNHFKFWVLSSIEWRLNEVKKQLNQMQKEIRRNSDDD